MKYIQAAPFINIINEEVLRIENSTPEQVLASEQVYIEARITDVLLLICNAYIPAPQQTLSIQGVRKFNNVMTTLERKYGPDGWMVFSEEELVVLEQICNWTIPRMAPVLLRNADRILSIIEQAPNAIPEQVAEDRDANTKR